MKKKIPKYQKGKQFIPITYDMLSPNASYASDNTRVQQFVPISQEQMTRNHINSVPVQHTVSKSKPQSILSKAKAIALNPMTAATYVINKQRIPDNFELGRRSIADYATDVINPAFYINAGKEAVTNTGEGVYNLSQGNVSNALFNFGTAGLNALAVAPFVPKGVKVLRAAPEFLTTQTRKISAEIVPTVERNVTKQLPNYSIKTTSGVPDISYDEFIGLDYNKRLDFINTVDETIKEQGSKIIKDLKSNEGKRRLINQFKEVDPNLSQEELESLYNNRVNYVAGTLIYNRAKWVKTVKDLKSTPKEAEEFIMSLNMADFFPYKNAHYSNTSLFNHSLKSSTSNVNNSGSSINLVKQNGFLEPDVKPGYITLGKGYEKSKATVSHEVAHAIQKNNKMPIDDELRKLINSYIHKRGNKVRGVIDDLWRAMYSGAKYPFITYNPFTKNFTINKELDYFLKGSKGREPYAFLRESRDVMLENKILNETYDNITAAHLTKTKKQLSNIDGNNRLFYFIPPWDRAKLAKIMNKAPGLMPYIGTGYFGYEELQQQKNGGEMIKRADGSYLRRGLWDNIRANKGSGKKPTKQMLEQEKKIRNNYQTGGVILNTGGEKHRIYVKPTNRGEGVKGHVMVNHPTMDKGMWDTIDLTEKAGATTIAQGVAATKKWHRENPYKKQEGGEQNIYWRSGELMVNDPSMDAISKVLLQRNLDKNFMQRAAGFGYQGGIPEKYINGQDPNSNYTSSLLMSSGGNRVFPTIIQTGPQQLSFQPDQREEYLEAPSWDVADYFATKGYKRAANDMYGMEYGNGGYVVRRSNDRKGKTHVVTGPDGTKKYFGDPNMGERSKSKYGKEAFYARHKKNIAKNPYFKAYAKATWQEGGEVSLPSFQKGGLLKYQLAGQKKPANPFFPFNGVYANKELTNKQIELAKQEMIKYGIPNFQRQAYIEGKSERAFNNITPIGYGDLAQNLERYARYKNNSGRNKNESLWYAKGEKLDDGSIIKSNIYFNIPKRDDAFRLYLGMPQKNNSFGVSDYTPTKSTNPNTVYFKPNYWSDSMKQYFINKFFQDKKIYDEGYNRDHHYTLQNERRYPFMYKTDSLEKAGIPYHNPITAEWFQDNPLGDFTAQFGSDVNGNYVSIYDKWDLNPFSTGKGASSNANNSSTLINYLNKLGKNVTENTEISEIFEAGKPFEVYDRIYYDKNGKIISPKSIIKRKKGGEVNLEKKYLDIVNKALQEIE